MSKETKAEVSAAQDALAHALVTRIDQMGQGRELMDHLGQGGTRALMDAYNRHDQFLGK